MSSLRMFVFFSGLLVLTISPGLLRGEYEVLTGDYGSHDPVMARQGDTYYVFCTGSRIPIRKSTDMHNWQYVGNALPSIPLWVKTYVPAYSGSSVWAPDISYFNGKYYLYHSFSTFGSNVSAIGLATNTTLNPSDPCYAWVDSGGPVVHSHSYDNFNTIDPALFIDTQSTPARCWLAFGSFWSGIKITEIDPDTGHPISDPPVLYSLAYNSSIEAAFIIYREPYYYLFVSFDSCCQGVNSTYNIRVGRATSVTGPYYDRNGTDMMSYGGNRLTWNNETWKGPGHNAVFLDNDGRYWIVHHAYIVPSGAAYLRIHELFWTEDFWPTLADQGPVDVEQALIAWWKFNEGSGTIAGDSSAHHYDGNILGATWVTDAVSRPIVISLDGTNDYIDLPDGLPDNFADFNGLTISLWAYPTAVKSKSRFIDLGNGQANNNIYFGRNSSTSDLIFEVYSGTSAMSNVVATGVIELNKWQHFTATIDEIGYSVLYKNGQPMQTGITPPPWNVTRANNYIGRSNWATYAYYQGMLDDIRIYNKTLSASDVNDIYWRGIPPDNCELVQARGYGLEADWTADCYVDFYDEAFMANDWLNNFDFDNLADFAELWLQCNNPADANCVPNW
jgi:arabinan endo-1,5-alpha-L-arabinosidase